MATDVQTLVQQGKCYACYGPTSMATLLRLALLRQIVLNHNPSAAVDPQSLLSDGRCYPCNSNASLAGTMELSLLSLWAT